jgi:hypothetical protein
MIWLDVEVIGLNFDANRMSPSSDLLTVVKWIIIELTYIAALYQLAIFVASMEIW